MGSLKVCVVDDDAAVRAGVALLLESGGIAVCTYESADAFLAGADLDEVGCLILDLRMPGMNGAELQEELLRRHRRLPVLFLSAHGDIPTTVRVIRAGAEDFLTKPINGAILLERVRAVLAWAREAKRAEATRQALIARLAKLTTRECQILALSVAGRRSKEIAQALGLSHRTVEVHRCHILSRTGASSLLALAQQVAAAGIDLTDDVLLVAAADVAP